MYAIGVYSAESVTDCSWLCMSLGLIFVYHFVILQGLGLVTILFVSFLFSVIIVIRCEFSLEIGLGLCIGFLKLGWRRTWTENALLFDSVAVQ